MSDCDFDLGDGYGDGVGAVDFDDGHVVVGEGEELGGKGTGVYEVEEVGVTG